MKINYIKSILLAVLLTATGRLFAQDGAAPVALRADASAEQRIKYIDQMAPTPPMGWNSWNTFQTHIDEKMLRDMVDTFVSSGMRDAGYKYFVLDDGWMAMERDQNGNLVPDPQKFPSGLKAFVDYVHQKGLKFGIYNCAGTKTCAGYPGTHGYEYQDARNYASWGVDFLKYDWCNTDSINARDAYRTMSSALAATGRPIVFSLCEWGNHQPWLWGEGVGSMWRTTGDITGSFANNKSYGNWTALSVLSILDKQNAIRQYAGPGHWNDPDMLEVGNGMKYSEDKAHFSLWAMLAAPLMAGNDLRHMSAQTREVLTNKDVIAIDQDSLGIEGFRYYSFDGMEIWVKPLSHQNLAVCFLNRSDRPQNVDYVWMDHLIQDNISHININFKESRYKLRDLWTRKEFGTTQKPFKATIPSHDVVMLKLTKVN